MSQFYDQASLVMIPSGYKNGKVYSQKPLSADGELTFTRASNATRVNADGLIEKVRTNLVLYSNDFSNATWINSTLVTPNNQTSPDGTLDADTFTTDGGNNGPIQSFTATNVPHTFSVYAKAGNYSIFRIFNVSSSTNVAWFDLTNGTTGNQVGGTSKIEAVGNGWYRCSYSTNAPNTTPASFGFILSASMGSTGGVSAGSTMYFYAAQIEVSDFGPTDYIETTTAAVSVGPVSGLPRLDYSGGATCPSLLLEPQRTNLALWSEQIDDASWGKAGVSLVANNTTSPDGYTNADKLAEDTSTGVHRTNKVTSLGGSVDSSPYCISIFAKAAGRTRFRFLDNSQNTSGSSYFDLSNGTVVSGTGKIENYGNGWYRCTIFPLKNFSTNSNAIIGLVSTGTTESYTGDGTSGVFFWGAQLEAGAYATSYIPTLGSAVTRLADSAYGAGTSSTFNDSEGVLFVEMSSLQDGRLAVKNSDGSDQVIFGTTNGNVFYRIRENNINIFTEFSGVSGRVNRKIALKYKSADTSIFVDGVKYNLNTSTYTLAGLNEFLFTSEGNTTYGNIKQTTYFPTALTDAQCIELTTL